MKLVGSQVVKQYLNRPIGKDYDYLASTKVGEFYREVMHESDDYEVLVNKPNKIAFKSHDTIFEIDFRPTTQKLLNILRENTINNLDLVYTLKMSHRYLKNSPHFSKTMHDIWQLRKQGAVIPDELQDWFKLREKETYNYKHPSLMQNKRDFFHDDGILYEFDHDSIHRGIALYDKPAYEYYKDDVAEVWCSKDKFDNCPEHIRLAGVYEEACVLALERSLIPFDFKPNPTKAFNTALMKVCTSITSGWFREYAWENYYEVQRMHNQNPLDYVKRFIDGVERGVIHHG